LSVTLLSRNAAMLAPRWGSRAFFKPEFFQARDARFAAHCRRRLHPGEMG